MQTKNVNLTIPVKIPYPILRSLLETKLIGMEIGNGERKRGRILRLSIQPSPLPKFDVVLGLQIELARKILWNKLVPLYIHATLDFDPESGRLAVGMFKIDVESKNFVLDKALEFLANRVHYRKVLDKAAINLNDLIASRLTVLNEKLESGIFSSQGIVVNGSMEALTITRIETDTEHIIVYVNFKGGAEVTLQSLPDMDF